MPIDCKRCEEMILDHIYGDLDAAASGEVAAHLKGCAACAGKERELRSVLGRLDVLSGGEEMTPGRVEAIRRTLEREAEIDRLTQPRRGSYGIFSRRFVYSAAAVLLIAIAITLIMTIPGSDRDGGSLAWAGPVVKHLSYELTVFNDDLALVKDKRQIVQLAKGDSFVRFADVAALIDPTSVRFESITDPAGTKVVEQNYEFDLATPGAIFKKYVDRQVQCIGKDGRETSGFLASYDLGAAQPAYYPNMASEEPFIAVQGNQPIADLGGRMGRQVLTQRRVVPPQPSPGSLTLTSEAGKGQSSIVSMDGLSTITFPTLPGGLLTKPTLVWKVRARKAGMHETLLAYQTRGFSWRADYVVTVNKDDVLDWQGWVTLTNRSGASFPDAKLKLIAGEVHRVTEQADLMMPYAPQAANRAVLRDAVEKKQFEEKTFFEYHLYTLSAPTSLNNNQTKQLKLLKADGVKSERKYIFDANRSATNALVQLVVWNKKENQLGMPLPKGVVRFRQADPDGEMEYIGTESIEHTPKDEKLELMIGSAFDVVGRRVLERESRSGTVYTQSWKFTLHNHKDAPVKVTVREHPSGGQWTLTVTNGKWDKIDQNTLECPVELPANGEAAVNYTIRYDYR
jgi:hypothetical protein